MRHDVLHVPETSPSKASLNRAVAYAAAAGLAAAFALFIWMDFVLPPLETFSATAIVALAWCRWIDRRASASAGARLRWSAGSRLGISD